MCLARLRVHTSPLNQVLGFISSIAFVFDAFDLQDKILTVDLVGRVEHSLHRAIRSIAKLFHEGIKSDRISLRGAVVGARAQGKLSIIDFAVHNFDGRVKDIASNSERQGRPR